MWDSKCSEDLSGGTYLKPEPPFVEYLHSTCLCRHHLRIFCTLGRAYRRKFLCQSCAEPGRSKCGERYSEDLTGNGFEAWLPLWFFKSFLSEFYEQPVTNLGHLFAIVLITKIECLGPHPRIY